MTDPSAQFPSKHFISTVLDALETKTAMAGGLARVYLMRVAMAGGLIGVGRIVGALVFGFALVFIYSSKSELLTSNMMMVSIGAYYRRTTPLKSLPILLLCYGGNIIGGLALHISWRHQPLGMGRSASRCAPPLSTRRPTFPQASGDGPTCLCAPFSATS